MPKPVTGGTKGTTRDRNGRLHIKGVSITARRARAIPTDRTATADAHRLAATSNLHTTSGSPMPDSEQAWRQARDADGPPPQPYEPPPAPLGTETSPTDSLRYGGGHLIAAALHDRTGWPVVAIGRPARRNTDGGCDTCGCDTNDFYDTPTGGQPPEWCDCATHHFAVRAPDGRIWDVDGDHNPADITPAGMTVRDVPDTTFAAYINRWENPPRLAAWADMYATKILDSPATRRAAADLTRHGLLTEHPPADPDRHSPLGWDDLADLVAATADNNTTPHKPNHSERTLNTARAVFEQHGAPRSTLDTLNP